MNIISLIISIVMLYVLYYIFENYNFTTGLIVNCIYVTIISIINNGYSTLNILISIIIAIIETIILCKIYSKSNSFGDFFVKVLLFGFVIIIILTIISFIIASITGSNSILSH